MLTAKSARRCRSRQPRKKATVRITTLESTQLEAAADLAVRLNADDSQHIGYFGSTPDEIREHVRSLSLNALTFLTAWEREQLIGLLAVEGDAELGRAWLHGPLVAAPAWQTVADQLYAAALPTIGPGVGEHELFCDVRNARCIAFAAAHGFDVHGDWHVLCFARAQLAAIAPVEVQPFAPAQRSALQQLHDGLFPTANMSSRQLLDGIGAHAQVFVSVAGEHLLGYVAATVDPATGEAFIDFIGVDERFRGQGIGRRLLSATLHWLFSWPRVTQVCLTVKTDNPAAQALYERTGFGRERTLRAFRKRV